jgi:hypothetical protein
MEGLPVKPGLQAAASNFVLHDRRADAASSLKLLASLALAAEYLSASLRRDRRAWILGIVTVAIVVTFASLLESGISTSPVIFMKLAEDQAGETDLQIVAEVSADNTLPLLNYTALAPGVAAAPHVAGCAPRWVMLADVANRMTPARHTSAYVLALDWGRCG